MEQQRVDLTRAAAVNESIRDEIEDLFAYHPWDDEQKIKGAEVREILATAYEVIIDTVPPCPTRTRALNMLVDCRMLANAAITHKGRY